MPTAKHHHDRLSPALLYYLVHGDLPPRDDCGGRTGLVEAFQLKHAQSAAARAELRRLWEAHANEILAATPAGVEPWVVRALRAPHIDDDETANDATRQED